MRRGNSVARRGSSVVRPNSFFKRINRRGDYMYNKPLFHIFNRGVYLYGICIAVGIVLCLLVFYTYTKRKKMPAEVQDFTFIVAIIAIALGFLFAKVYQAIYDWIETGFKTFDFYGAGITFMGGVIGGAATFLLVYFLGGKLMFKGAKANLHVKEFNKTFLCAPCCITIAHAFGRIGCLMAGCCSAYLGSTYVFGGIYMEPYGAANGYYVPTQLYEALFLFALFGVLSLLYFKESNITMSIYLIAYGAWRMFIEFFRADDRGAVVLGLYPSQWQSVVFIAVGIAILVIYAIRKKPFMRPSKPNKKENAESVSAVEAEAVSETETAVDTKKTAYTSKEEIADTAANSDDKKNN